ncbi:hypothetical protein [Streptomyces millisiae]|uniref:Uncharacterized protein n=1 Tax=Streptomyces millisiae TaxID=3075542 RepID=A0ABU2LK46_9ACTN|nr:hypothetical protein [Streptomyces sp. DSM 44918]MDT0317870.1 hypothetical protein [Streptomyces sp. DSM 44918]
MTTATAPASARDRSFEACSLPDRGDPGGMASFDIPHRVADKHELAH